MTVLAVTSNDYSNMVEQRHSQIVVNDSVQTYIQEHTAYNHKQELQNTMNDVTRK